jgi:hypothetical protein
VDRYRWLATLVLAIVAVAALIGARSAAALTPPPFDEPPVAETMIAAANPVVVEEDDEAEEAEGDDEGEEEAVDCESDDQAAEEACEEALEAKEETEAEAAEAEECRLDSAEATVSAVPGRSEVRLTVRYRTYEPSAVAVDLRLRGTKGALDLGTSTAHFGPSGTLHSTENLSDAQMIQAMAAREFTVAIQAVNTPHFCREEFERHLTSRQGAGPGLHWADPTAARRAREARAARAGF